MPCTRRCFVRRPQASLLPDQVRPAFLWTIRLDAPRRTRPMRASSGPGCARSPATRLRRGPADRGSAHRDPDAVAETLGVLEEVGVLRLAWEADRGGRSTCPCPDQESTSLRPVAPGVPRAAAGRVLERPGVPAHGFAAAPIMLAGKIGILRTLPPRPRLRRQPVATYRSGARRSTGPAHRLPGVHPPWTPRTSSSWRWSGLDLVLRGAGTPPSTGTCPTSRSTPPWPRRTPMSPRPCGGSSTARSRGVRRAVCGGGGAALGARPA